MIFQKNLILVFKTFDSTVDVNMTQSYLKSCIRCSQEMEMSNRDITLNTVLKKLEYIGITIK